MMQIVLYFIPCLVCFFWALIYAMHQSAGADIKFLRNLLFLASFYFLSLALYMSPKTDYLMMSVLGVLTRPAGLMVLAMNLKFALNNLRGDRQIPGADSIIAIPIIVQTTAVWSVYLAVGFVNAAALLEAMDKAWDMGASYPDRWSYMPEFDVLKYHLFVAVTQSSCHLLSAIYALGIMYFIFRNMYKSNYKWGTMARFFFLGRAVPTKNLVSLLMLLIIILLLSVVALGRHHPIIGGLGTFFLGVVLYIMSIVTLRPEFNFITLRGVFHFDPFAPPKAPLIPPRPEISASYMLLCERLRVALDEERIYLNSDINLNDLAGHLGTNRTTLSNLINHSYGKSFKNLIADKRIEYALQYMKAHPDVRVEEVADLSGFNNPSVFYSRFKEFTGSSPRQWRIKNCRK